MSNVVEFTIIPAEPAWCDAELERAVERLGDPKAGGCDREAARCLRFLGTEGAARAMARRMDGGSTGCSLQYKFGLFGSPHRRVAVEEMERLLRDPGHPVSWGTLWTLAALTHQVVDPERAFPGWIGDESLWTTEETKRLLRELVGALPDKQGAARRATLQTVFELVEQGVLRKAGIDAAGLPELGKALSAEFAHLPTELQLKLLRSHWKLVRSPELVPSLRRLARMGGGESKMGARTLAWERLREVEPEEVDAWIREEIRVYRDFRRVDVELLRSLPEERLPALERTLVANLRRSIDERYPTQYQIRDRASLVQRYATSEVVDEVHTIYRDLSGEWGNNVRAPMLAFLLEHDRERGLAAIRAEAGQWREHDSYVLYHVARYLFLPELEAIACDDLENDRLERVADAATVLRQHGGEAARSALWRRMEEWSRTVKAREEPLPDHAYSWADEGEALVKVGTVLWQAIAYGRGWLSTKDDLERLLALHLVIPCSPAFRSMSSSGQIPNSLGFDVLDLPLAVERWDDDLVLRVRHPHSVGGRYQLAHYNLETWEQVEERLAQLPSGTVLDFDPSQGNLAAPEAAAEERRFLDALERHQLTIPPR